MSYKRIFEIDEWKVIEKSLHKEDMRLAESITSLGNGYMGMRGNFEEKYSGDMHRGTYIAGVWFPDPTRVGWWKNGYPKYFGKVINATNFIGIDVFVDGEELDLYKTEIEEYYRELDMKNGMLYRRFIANMSGKRTLFEVTRFVSIANKELCLISYEATPLNYDGEITFVPYLDGDVFNEDSNYNEQFWLEVDQGISPKEGHLIMKTKENPFGTPRFTVCTSMRTEASADCDVEVLKKDKYVGNKLVFKAKKDEKIQLIKYISVVTSRDYEETALKDEAFKVLDEAVKVGFNGLKEKHSQAWHKRWEKADVEIKGDPEAQQGIRFNLFQMFSTYYGDDPRLNIGPKGFTGEKYGGATYWDTEAYALPMYLSVADQEVARNLLLYRYNQLEGAYHNARQQGLKGALYPMVTFTGVECHNEWEITFEEIHRNGAIAYAIYNYVNYTGDKEYLHPYGIDVLVGISRFWADRVHYHKKKDVYMIHGVTGPNEYENNVNNNWYTNTMAAWTLSYTLKVIDYLNSTNNNARLKELNVTEEEKAKWKEITDKMYYPYDEELGIFVQHDTFLDKDLMTVDQLSPEDRPLNQKWSWDKILRSCFIKQADVLQGLYFLNDQFTFEEKKRNFEFYEPMTVHESSLSSCIHSILAAELKMEEKAVEMYKRTARLDLDNYNNDTEDGLHITSMSGSWLSIVQGFAGMRTFNEELSFSPFIPKDWESYSFKINYRDRLIKVLVDKKEIKISLEKGEALDLKLYGEKITLKDTYQCPLTQR
ncbi:glycoside hydrolase family 65 protein [Defluviitalea raffinosedens]|uniref:Glycoside hydrolase family 65 protein n=1 Tax=Defluviitalea raffinosedens TaxID=1450156 RepID=A0A7C8LBN2_9FIRM|nr:glycoside hydrolase family 65 protein [Defluviitalea raffinosedens]KAE9632915.1 glycoside hydrolase family 65 protein [Defluviitalea raffinosedens]MBM7684608.1 maltose phosphorylase [Defluviitalea raffinosedens]HHW68291.1 glycoside hydrolase family 65 protein [Candidatus Epulonipiscium sp.]